jgi:hypothetical protein
MVRFSAGLKAQVQIEGVHTKYPQAASDDQSRICMAR